MGRGQRLDLNVGTKSILFGVHQFLWHPLTVGAAWRSLYGVWPRWHEWVAIFCHDVGYWGTPDMDGEIGQRHPVRGAKLAERIVLRAALVSAPLRHPIRYWIDQSLTLDLWCEAFELSATTYRLSLGHSRFYAQKAGIPLSKLFRADKACIFFDPKWFYLLRSHSSGEIWEFKGNAGARLSPDATTSQWFDWYRAKVRELL